MKAKNLHALASAKDPIARDTAERDVAWVGRDAAEIKHTCQQARQECSLHFIHPLLGDQAHESVSRAGWLLRTKELRNNYLLW